MTSCLCDESPGRSLPSNKSGGGGGGYIRIRSLVNRNGFQPGLFFIKAILDSMDPPTVNTTSSVAPGPDNI